jgi:hypothetical protein
LLLWVNETNFQRAQIHKHVTLGARRIQQSSFSIMTLRAIVNFIILLLVTHVSGQTRTLTGKIIDDEFNPLAQVSIFRADTVLLAKSDMNGNFSITIPADTKALIVADVETEKAKKEKDFAQTIDYINTHKEEMRKQRINNGVQDKY